ncbi:hypothetical protein AF72_03840 [Xylella taiwanensis]|uniref:Uncharacterized protein n=1 Tax=Xylella taiwanensis TaxID=1444770 RepID=Z9JLR7_9GAMM|nr:hypothetical protein AF72_03840 [Xylella taiwanensis]
MQLLIAMIKRMTADNFNVNNIRLKEQRRAFIDEFTPWACNAPLRSMPTSPAKLITTYQ